jgi:hypothetical protein
VDDGTEYEKPPSAFFECETSRGWSAIKKEAAQVNGAWARSNMLTVVL